MSTILTRYLRKIGVKSPLDLNDEERATYNLWSEALAGRRLTDADVADFLNKEFLDATSKVTNPNITPREDMFLKVKMEFITKVKLFLATPALEQKAVELHIESQL